MKDKQLSSRKLKTFRLLAIALPFVFLILFEVLLRVFGYGHSTDLFIRYPDDTSYWVMNKYASDRFFSDTSNATKGSIELFKVHKSPNTCRIFVLGESTTAGYPYFHNGSFHRWLKYRMMREHPNINFEIINVSLTAVNSYTVLEFAKQVVNYQPDAILIYTGHNEYYGALGVGSTSNLGNSHFWIETIIELRKLRMVQLFDNAINSFKSHKQLDSDQKRNLMERMAANQKIPYNSPDFWTGINQFKENMTDVCDIMYQHHIPVFLSTVVSNEKDLKPFISENNNSNSANSEFAKGQSLLRSGNFKQAKIAFDAARELDMLRFRAPDEINTEIKALANQFSNVRLVDAEKTFEEHSPNGIVGNETILEHVHPNLYGYALLSDAFYSALMKSGIIKDKMTASMSFNELLQSMPVTKVDSLNGAYTIIMLEAGWPFNKPIPADFSRGNTLEEQIAGALSVHKISWLEAMNGLFQFELKENNKRLALQAVKAAMLDNPMEKKYALYAGRLSFELGLNDESIFYFTNLYNTSPSIENTVDMYLIMLKTDQPEKAVKYIDDLIKYNGMQLDGLKTMVNQLIDLKNKLNQSPGDKEIKAEIADDYHKIGIDEVVAKYQ